MNSLADLFFHQTGAPQLKEFSMKSFVRFGKAPETANSHQAMEFGHVAVLDLLYREYCLARPQEMRRFELRHRADVWWRDSAKIGPPRTGERRG
jgi:hypothetical protein